MKSARHICDALGGRWAAGHGVARCPAHDDHRPSLSIAASKNGMPLVHCFAGCEGRDVIATLRWRGLWDDDATADPNYPTRFAAPPNGRESNDYGNRQEYAWRLWDRAMPASRTLTETYLRARGIRIAVPSDLRFVPRLVHAPSRQEWPCMIAALRDDRGNITAVQRTFLAVDGMSKAPVESPKRTMGPMGSGAVRLGPALEMLGLAEGIETALSASQLYGFPVWATLSANRLGKIALPTTVRRLTIFADHGRVGMSAALAAADEYERRGLVVDVLPPRVHFGEAPKDFNDALRASA